MADEDETETRSKPEVDEEPVRRRATAIERILGRDVTHQPPDMHDWIRKYGGYVNITPEGWADYKEAMRRWDEERMG